MAIKTFTTGEVLTAADTNTYLANSGLVFVKSQTIGTAVSSVTVSSAFSADYDGYKIVVIGGVGSGSGEMNLTLGASVTGYYAGLNYVAYGSTTPVAATNNNAAAWNWCGSFTTTQSYANFELFGPFQAKPTFVVSDGYASAVQTGRMTGFHNVATSYTAFTLTASAGTMTGGTITVYGYRKA